MIGTNLAITTKNYAVTGSVTYDADALAYFTANTAITSDADKNAINTFYLGLKSDGLYTKMKAMYLPIWGSATSSKWNLKDPRDIDAAFRLTFTTGWTFSSSGMTPNGTSSYANTKIIPNTTLSLNSTHISSYIRNSSQGVLLGTDGSSLPGTRLWISPNFNGTNRYVQINTNSTTPLTPINSNVGLWLGSRTSATVSKLYNNGSINYTSSESSSGLDLTEIILGARNTYPTISNYSTSQICFSSIGNGLTDTESTNFYNRVNTLMTYFGINV